MSLFIVSYVYVLLSRRLVLCIRVILILFMLQQSANNTNIQHCAFLKETICRWISQLQYL